METKKITLIVPWYRNILQPYSGIFFHDQAKALSKLGHKVDIINCARISWREFYKVPLYKYFIIDLRTEDNINVYQLFSISLPRPKKRFLKTPFSLLANSVYYFSWFYLLALYAFKNRKIDIIHMHGHHLGRLSYYFSSLVSAPYIITEHWSGFYQSTSFQCEKKQIMAAFSEAKNIIAVSDNLKKTIEHRTHKKVSCIPNGVFCEEFSATPCQSNKFTFIIIGNLIPLKQVNLAILATARLVNKGIDVQLKIVGSGPVKDELNDLVMINNLFDRVTFCGALNRNLLSKELSSSHCLLSLSSFETFGVSIIESFAAGRPVIAVNTGSRPDLIKNKKLGILVDDDLNSIVLAMEHIVKEYPAYSDCSYIRKYAEENFDFKIISKKLVDTYSGALT